MGRGGLEPPRPCGQQILSLSRLPFRHQPSYIYFNKKRTLLHYFYKRPACLFFKRFKPVVKFAAELGFYAELFQIFLQQPVIRYRDNAPSALV